MDARDIIIKPVVTEKSVSLMEHNKYVFRVALSVKGKVKRMGRYEGKTSDYKKAVVQLAEGDSIEIFEGM